MQDPREIVNGGEDESRGDLEFGAKFDRDGGIVDAGDLRSESSPGERVHAGVALEMKQRLPTHVAEFFQLDRSEAEVAGPESDEVVEVKPLVDRHYLVPELPIGFEVRTRIVCGVGTRRVDH